MPIGSLPPDEKPRIHEVGGEVVIWVQNGEEPIGLQFSAEAGIDTGLKCLAVSAGLLDRPVASVRTEMNIEDNVELDEELAGRLLFKVEGAPFEIPLSATQVCELAATFTAMAKRFD